MIQRRQCTRTEFPGDQGRPSRSSTSTPPGHAGHGTLSRVTTRRILLWIVIAAALIAAIVAAILLSGSGAGDAGTGY